MFKLQFILLLATSFCFSQITPITDANFLTAINTCLTNNPENGMCSESEYGSMPYWDVSNVTDMEAMFYRASSFNQNISNWCVTTITSEPDDFSTDSPLSESNKPVWGTCPSITAIPDANFEQALIDFGLDSKEIDGQVLTANINGVTSIDLGGFNISDLTGIEGFTALEYLRCEYNQLTSLDVSQNTALENLECNNNQITSLDLSANTALNTLLCYTNQLTSLDLSANPALEILTCNSNSLTTLDLSSNPNLEILNVGNNQLETLDLRNGNNAIISYFIATFNPNLSCIYVDNPSDSNDTWQIDPDTFLVADETACSALSVEDYAFELDVTIYPNPTDSYLFVQGRENPVSVSIYNLLGEKVLFAKNTHSVDVKEFSNGVYFIRISDGLHQSIMRFVKN